MFSFDTIKILFGLFLMAAGALLFLLGGMRDNNHVKIETIQVYEGGGAAGSTGMANAMDGYTPGGVDPLIGADTPPSEYGALLAQGAYNSVGISTAGIPGTEGGNLGCAAATCIMFQNTTGQQLVPGQDIVLGTGQLYNSLSNDPRFVAVAVNNAQPGDIVVTASRHGSGHTGVVGNGGDIISNSSSGFQGSARGTIQNNYTIDRWQSSVTPRNPGQTMAFRYVGG